MIKVNASITIYRPRAQVFDFVSAPANDFEWQYGTLASGQISRGAAGLGASFRTIGHLMGHRMHRTFEITEYEAGTKFGFRSLSGPLESHTLYRLETANGSTRIDVSTQALAINALTVRESELEKHMQRQLREDLALLKTVLESSPREATPTPGAARP
jgi:hypothetical protein